MRTGALIGTENDLYVKGLGSQGMCCTTVTIIEVRLRSRTRLTRSHICRHANAKECAEDETSLRLFYIPQ